ncbi:phosphotransferase family protein [Neobacillus sp. GCM10023253]|uniref:phosphotransferase family protein n=1 Tax=Neobacillus sp. GCM10023253 TaxID=3252644 RepID=UPI0036202484
MNIQDTIPVREGEELNLSKLEELIRKSLPNLSSDPMTVKQFSAGKSNLTYLISIGDWEGVLRRAPLGPVNTKAHDMKREFKVLDAISPIFSLAPKPYFFIDDESIIGAPFYCMKRLHGVLLDQALPNHEDGNPALFNEVSHSMVNTLAAIHEIDYKNTNLVNLTRPQGFLERQVHGWIGRYQNVKTEEIPGMERLIKWIIENRPVSQPATFIHYDFHLKNVLFSKNQLGQLAGILDWEMSTVGDPLNDLASALVLWFDHDDPEFFKNQQLSNPITLRPGFMTRNEFIEAYSKKSGRDVSKMYYYMVFGYFKHVVIAQQMYYRWKRGQTQDERFAQLDIFVKNLTDWALENTLKK